MKQNNIIRYIPVLAIIVLVLVAAALLWLKLKPKDEGLKIDETANVVTEIRKIAQFTSACYYEDVILKDKKANETLGGKVVNSFSKKDKPILEDEIVIVASGNVRAGFDLSKLSEKDIVIRDSVLEVTLPKAEIFEVIVNPSGFDVYIEDGTWSHEQVTKVENKAMNKIRKDAINDGLLDKASELGIQKLSELFKSFGFSQVLITTE
ncbi:MAG: DUF4230 domain-containing protein [Bacteroidales bacterium]|nr:DUF4230 domain-containing protein [Bacteroidales bacterium]